MAAPLGLMSIATYLNANGHQARIGTDVTSKRKIIKEIESFSPDIIGVSVISAQFINNALLISKTAKKLGYTVIWGGTMASVIPATSLESGVVDYVSLREGELTWLDIANAFDNHFSFDTIPGLAYLKNGSYIETEPRELLDLSTLPRLDWTLINPNNYFSASYGCKKSIHIYWSKGCVGNCSFCYNGDFNCSKRRERPLEYVIDEMKYLINNFGADGFEFTDDLMFANTNQMRTFCNAILENDLHFCWTCYLRIGIVNEPQDYELMRQTGCRCLMFGIETGSKRIQHVIHKGISEQKIKDNITACSNAGIIPLTTFMMAFPDETEEDLKETIRLINQFDRANGILNLLNPQPGTELYDDLVKQNRIKPMKSLKQYSKVRWGDNLYVNTSAVSTKELYTIAHYYSLKSMFLKSDDTPEKHFWDTVKNVLKSMKNKGVVEFIRIVFLIFFKLISFFTLFLHPGIRKKYDLYFK